MIARKGASVILVASLLFLAFGCDREKPKTNFQLGKEYFRASDYKKAMIRLETWVQSDLDADQLHTIPEARAMLAVIYHNDETRKPHFEAELKKIQEMGEPGIVAVLKLMENKAIADRLGNAIRDTLVRVGELSIGPLMKDLKSNNWRLRVNAQRVLIDIGELAVEPLIENLDYPDLYVRSMSIEALNKIGDKRAIEPLKKKLDDPSKLIQVEVAAALHNMGQINPTKVIISALEDESVDARRAAAKAIWEIIDDPPVKTLLKAMKDTDPQVRNYAALSAGKTRSTEAIQPLMKMLEEDNDDQIRDSAAKALENIGKPAVDPLIKTLEGTSDMAVTIRIVHILGNIGDKRAIKPLEKVYKEATNPLLRNETAKALNQID